MRRCHPSPKGLRQTETRSRLPCAPSISRPSHRSKTDTHSLVELPSTPTKPETRIPFSCDDSQPFHFPVEPDAVDHQRDGSCKRPDRTSKINRCAFHQIDPDAPSSGPDRKQRRENNENDMESLKGHLPKDRVVVPRQKCKPEEAEHKKAGENQDPIDEPFFRGQMHEDRPNGARFQ